MEDLSLIYEDIDINACAQDIRLSKTEQLREMVYQKEQLLKAMIHFCYPEHLRESTIDEIDVLKRKLYILETK